MKYNKRLFQGIADLHAVATNNHCHSEPVRTLLRAKSRLRRLRSVQACGPSGVGIRIPCKPSACVCLRHTKRTDCHTSLRTGSQ